MPRTQEFRQVPKQAHASAVKQSPNNTWSAPATAEVILSRHMQFGPRLMRRRPPFGQPPEEIESLHNVLSSAPGVAAVRSIELHRKGGYVAIMDFDRNSLDEFINHIEAAGWMSVF